MKVLIPISMSTGCGHDNFKDRLYDVRLETI